MTSPTHDSPRNITPSLFGLIGGALATLGFFLPWSGGGNTTTSGWDIVSIYLTGKINSGNGSAGSTSISVPLAVFFAIPLLLALVALIIGVTGLRVRNTALISGLYGASGIVGFINYQANVGALRISLSGTNPGSTGLGLGLLNLGYFGIIIASIVSLAHYVKSAKTDAIPLVSD